MSERVLVTGANGFIGGRVVERLRADGHEVIPAARRAPGRWRAFDLDAGDPAICEGIDSLVHCALVPFTEPDAERRNVEGSEALRLAADEAGVGKRVLVSSLAAATPQASAYARSKRRLEELWSADAASIRPGLVIGTGGLCGSIIAAARRFHVLPMVGAGRQPVHPVWVDDLAGAIAAALAAAPGTYTVAHPEPVPYRELWRRAFGRLGIRASLVPVPRRVLLLGAGAAGRVGVGLVSEESIRGADALVEADPEPDLQRLGIEVRDLEASLAALAAEYGVA